jgi:hypothetical protein
MGIRPAVDREVNALRHRTGYPQRFLGPVFEDVHDAGQLNSRRNPLARRSRAEEVQGSERFPTL